MQRRLATEEGIFCEPAAAVSVAAAIHTAANGEIAPTDRICCIVTGSGFKDAASVDRMVTSSSVPLLTIGELIRRAGME
jgi:threonine synthase